MALSILHGMLKKNCHEDTTQYLRGDYDASSGHYVLHKTQQTRTRWSSDSGGMLVEAAPSASRFSNRDDTNKNGDGTQMMLWNYLHYVFTSYYELMY